MGLTRKQIVMLAVLISGTFITILNQTLVTPALPTIMSDMSVDASTVQWLTTGFTMVNAVMIPVTAYLTDRFNTRSLYVVALSVFCVGTLLCGWGPNFPVMLGGRLIQAAGAGVLMPMVMTVLLLTFPVEKRGFAMGLFGVVIMFAPALGPTVAGIVIDNANWHILFIAVAVLVAIDILLALFILDKKPKEVPDGLNLDKTSVLMSTVGFGCMLYGFSVIGNSGISAPAVVSVVVGVVVTVLFFRRQLKLEVPMLEVRVLETRRFLVATILGMIVQGGIMANGVLIPIYVQTLCGQPATVSGLVMLPGAIVMGVMGPIAGAMFDKRGPRGMVVGGMVLLTAATVVMCNLSTSTPMVALAVLIALRNLSMSLVNGPINTWGMNALPNRYINHGNAVNNTLRQAAGSLGTALVVSAYSIATSLNVEALGAVDASMLGINVAFVVQVALFGAGAILAIITVREKAGDGASGLSGEPAGAAGNGAAGSDEVAAASPAEQTAADLMRPEVLSLPETATVAEAVALFRDKHVDAALLLSEDGALRGIINDGDIVRALQPRTNTYIDPVLMIVTSQTLDADAIAHLNEVMESPALEYATTNVVTIEADEPVAGFLDTFGTHHLSKAPVVRDGRVVGVLNRDAVAVRALGAYLENKGD